MADSDGQAGGFGQFGEFGFPQPRAVAVGATAVGADQQPGSVRVQRFSDLLPPSGDGVDRERGGVMVGAHRYPTGVVGHVVHTVRIGLAQRGVDEVVDLDRFRLTDVVPFPSTVLVGTDEQLLLGVDADHRVPAGHVLHCTVVEVPELGVPVDVLTTPSAVFTFACRL